jgi:hypothetical protein
VADDPSSVADALTSAIGVNLADRHGDPERIADNVLASLRAAGYEVVPAGTTNRLAAAETALAIAPGVMTERDELRAHLSEAERQAEAAEAAWDTCTAGWAATEARLSALTDENERLRKALDAIATADYGSTECGQPCRRKAAAAVQPPDSTPPPTLDCCCHRGAARGDEYPEDPCRDCPVHLDTTSEHQCRRHSTLPPSVCPKCGSDKRSRRNVGCRELRYETPDPWHAATVNDELTRD